MDAPPQDISSTAAFYLPKEFEEDANLRLGRANGNVYRRKPGIEGVHDGQIMVRLKKKRFLVLDYSPEAGGSHVCSCTDCNKIAVPALLYDSDPNEPSSLYLRSGHCFTCQRTVNEKRRSQRRSDGHSSSPVRLAGASALSNSQLHGDALPSLFTTDHFLGHKKLKRNTHDFFSRPSASSIIIDGPLEGTKLANNTDYGFVEIGMDVQNFLRDAVQDMDQLMSIATTSKEQEDASMMTAVDTTTSSAIAVAAAIAAGTTEAIPTMKPSAPAVAYTAEVETAYQKAMSNAKKCVFLLGQWKLSWDSTLIGQQLALTEDNNNGDAEIFRQNDGDEVTPFHADGTLSMIKEEILSEANVELETFAV